MRSICAAVLVASFLALSGCRKPGPPYSAGEALRMFRIESGYRIEVFATEPDVVSPVAMEFDEDGRIYVVEDRGYPLNTDKVGRIKLLEDTNGDGKPDRVTLFADHLVLPTGVMRWKKGILVTDAPDVLYLEDTNGDGRADIRKIVLTGFPFTNPQHTLNSPVYGLDNWIYIAHENATTAVIFKEKFGDRGTDLHFADRSDAPRLKERGRNIRFRPDTYELEALSGTSQFGHAFDEWGHHFTLNNSNHLRQEVIAARYLRRNPALPVASSMQDVSDHGTAAKVFPIAAQPRLEMLTNVGVFTSACGLTFWRGSSFVAEPAHNLVHRDLLSPKSSTFVARRAHEGVEFLASTDPWFRPVNFTVGPDGALYLMDYYRLVIEHPEWMSTRFFNSQDLSQGVDRGRIYRIVPDSENVPYATSLRLGRASSQELVKHLAHPVPWWRRTAQRLLVDRKAADVADDLTRLYQESPSAVGRLHALWTLQSLGKLDDMLVGKALADPEAGIRENAVVLAESRPALRSNLLQLADDPNPRVRFQLLASLGSIKDAAAMAVRDRLLFDNLDDRWFQIAALSAGSEYALPLFQKVMAMRAVQSPGRAELLRNLCAVIAGQRKEADVDRVLQRLATAPPGSSWWQTASLEGLASSMPTRQAGSEQTRHWLLQLFAQPEAEVRRAALRLLASTGLPSAATAHAALQRASRVARDQQAVPELRADQIGLLALTNDAANAPLFRQLIVPHEPEPVQVAAVRALGRIAGEDAGAFLLKNWRNMTGAVRTEAAEAMYIEPARERMLVAALKSGAVQPWTLNFRQKSRLIMNSDRAIRDAARPLLEQSPADREAVVKQYTRSLELPGNGTRGRQVFERVCEKCHLLDGKGSQVGPDLATVRNQPKQVLLTDILIPSQAIAQGYESYVLETSNGTYDGVIGPQTTTTIALRHEDGKEDLIQRRDIKNMHVTNLSGMPADLEKEVSVQQMADLLEYLKTGGAAHQ